MILKQKTIQKDVCLCGIGVHSGSLTEILLKPAEENAGIIFTSSNFPKDKLIIGSIVPEETMHATVVKNGKFCISTIEHLMATVSSLGIDNLIVEVDGPEIPIFDGSALPFVQAILNVGIKEQSSKKFFITPKKILKFEDKEGRSIEILPHIEGDPIKLLFNYGVDFDHPLAGKGILKGELKKDFFINEIAPARTFGFLSQLSKLRQYKLAQGSSLGNTVVIGEDDFINEKRFEDEFVRHKFLDLIGDLACLGKNLVGTINARKTGHRFNRLVVEHFIKNPDSWKSL